MRRRRIIIVFWFLWFIASFGRSAFSTPANNKPLSPLQQVQQVTLNNGLQLFYAPLPQASFFKFTIYVWAGSVDENNGHTPNNASNNEGAAHFIEHLLFSRPDLSEQEFDRAIATMGGSHNAFTHRPFTRFFVFLPKQHLKRGSELLWKTVFNDHLMSNKRQEILQVIDRENSWSDPTWIDNIKETLSPPKNLQLPEFWQEFFDLADYDRPVGGRAEFARNISFAEAAKFHQTYYTVPNMSAIYVGPAPLKTVVQQLNQLATQLPGNRDGILNLRAACHPPMDQGSYRRLEFDDQQPSITMGFLVDRLRFADSPFITLYTEGLNRTIYREIRQQSAETYATDRFVETFRDCGYLAFRTQASRAGFPTIHQFMRHTMSTPLAETLSAADFEENKSSYLNYVGSRLENPEFLEAYLSLMLREHPTHQPTSAEIDWVSNVAQVTYQDLQHWTAQRLQAERRYEHLNAPSQFIPYEILPLFILSCLGVFVFWKRWLIKPANLRGMFHGNSLKLFPLGWAYLILVYYPCYQGGQYLLYFARLGLTYLLRHDFPLYLSGYLNVVMAPVILGTVLILSGFLIPRKLLLTKDRLTIKFFNPFSCAVPFSNIKSIHLASMSQIFRHRALPLHIFWGEALLIERHQGRPLACRVAHPELFMAAWHQGAGGDGYRQQLLFPEA